MYCFKCRISTDTTDISQILSINNKQLLRGKCVVCKTKKCKIIPNSKSGGTLKSIKPSTKETKKSEIKLDDAYYNPETGFCGINELQRKTKKPIEEVKRFLNEQDVYTLHKPARKNFKSERVYVHNIDEQWQSDLVEMIPYAEENNDFKYLLTVIDCFSKYAWVIPLKTKTGKETASALQTIFKHRKPQKMQTDNGKEYYNKEMKLLFKESDIRHFSTYSDKKASIIERFNRTLKEKMWKMFTYQGDHKWTKILDKLVSGYNNHFHRGIKMTPIEASKTENVQKVHDNLFPSKKLFEESPKSKFKIDDTVRITKYKAVFAKGYLPNWSTEMFKISEVHPGEVISYSIRDLADEEIKGKFYEEELTFFNNVNDEHKIESILKRRTRKGQKELFVKWYGYPDKFNSWIPDTNLN
ncbi:Protein CBG07546 [Caenorhabditis briggsae]|uniref:Protein CBG07229 n=1 Tax=Caenorhabditis briggsae TaxID=6238 RepID=G2J6L2_CAEBR|nr:Protein CBG07229 [Caenorhabditis briggsae]XP_002645818.1 Protein CBG07546 [Caenorhabditis briggsae]CAP27572.1 Protein CBG07546 [Caenorhabditis briggsae]CAP27768.1 Protein CBG07229 [Caenorhabditis briggsae]